MKLPPNRSETVMPEILDDSMAGAHTRKPLRRPLLIFEYEPTSTSTRSRDHLEQRARSLVGSLCIDGCDAEAGEPTIYLVQAGSNVLRELGEPFATNASQKPVEILQDREGSSRYAGSPLVLAVENKDLERVTHLLATIRNIMQSHEGLAALTTAVEIEAIELVDAMLERCVYTDHLDRLLPELLSVAVWKGNSMIVRLLLRKGAKYDMKDSQGKTLLMIAASRDFVKIVRSLLDFGADIKAVDILGRSAIHVATLQGNASTVRVLLEEGADFNMKDEEGFSPLHLAVSGKSSEVVGILLDHRAEKATTNAEGDTPLETAIRHGSITIIKLLVSARACLKPTSLGHLPLHIAAKYIHTTALKLLLELGAPPRETNGKLENALHIAAKAGHVAAIDPLVNAGCVIDSTTESGHTPLFLAVERGFTQFVNALLLLEEKRGRSHDITTDRKSALLHAARMETSEMMATFLSYNRDIMRLRFESNQTLLHVAIRESRSGTAAVLLVHGATPDVADDGANTPLSLAIKTEIGSIVSLMLERYPRNAYKPCFNGETPLVYAAKGDYVGVIPCLLVYERSCKNRPEGDETAALLEATKAGHCELVRALVTHGFKVDEQDPDGNSAIHIAARAGNIEMVNTLIDVGANFNNVHKTEGTPLNIAVYYRQKQVLTLLLERGADPEIPSGWGIRPLHRACYKKIERTDIVELLLRHKVKIDARYNSPVVANNCTALHLAVFKGFQKTAELLLKYGTDPFAKNSRQETPTMVAERLLNGTAKTSMIEMLAAKAYAAYNKR